VRITFGFGMSQEDYGILMYHRNRLIKAYEKVGYQKHQVGNVQFRPGRQCPVRARTSWSLFVMLMIFSNIRQTLGCSTGFSSGTRKIIPLQF